MYLQRLVTTFSRDTSLGHLVKVAVGGFTKKQERHSHLLTTLARRTIADSRSIMDRKNSLAFMSSESAAIDEPHTSLRNPAETLGDLENHGNLENIIDTKAFNDVMAMSPGKRIEALRSMSASWPVGEGLTKLQAIIHKMMEEERRRGHPLEPMQMTIRPSEYDVVITDISESEIQNIGTILGVEHLSVASDSYEFPVNGIMYGQNLRIFVPLVVKKRNIDNFIRVNFLFDTASPVTFLRKQTFEALGFRENIPAEVVAEIHGISVHVHLSHGHFANVDIIGQDYLRRAGITTTLNYNKLSVMFSVK